MYVGLLANPFEFFFSFGVVGFDSHQDVIARRDGRVCALRALDYRALVRLNQSILHFDGKLHSV